MTQLEKARQQVEKGRKGENFGIPTGFEGLDKFICNIQPATYYLLGAETSTGKSAFADTAFVLNPLLWLYNEKTNDIYCDIEYNVDYYSFEISADRKINKWASVLIYLKYGRIADIGEILSKGEKHMDDELKKMYDSVQPMLEWILERVTIYDYPLNPTGIYKNTEKWFLKNGKIKEEQINGEKRTTYISDNPKCIKLNIVDHLGLARREQGFSKKENIDKLSEYAIYTRNLFSCSWLPISQFNRELGDFNRKKFQELQPQNSDFKDSGNTQEDAETVFALFNPMKYNISNYLEFDINKLGHRLRFFSLLKNRDGIDNERGALNFLGESGYFRSIGKKGSQLTYDDEQKILNFTK